MKNSGEMHRLIIKWFPMVCNPQQVRKSKFDYFIYLCFGYRDRLIKTIKTHIYLYAQEQRSEATAPTSYIIIFFKNTYNSLPNLEGGH